VIREVSWRLRELGYLPRHARIRSKPSPALDRALRRYQHDRHIAGFGYLGPRTMAQLDADLARIAASSAN
jgi:peptidoglycan hydrolase-like protein with peptidoglycan-binding domain